MARILVFSGGGDYSDPWHPFAETSAIIAGILREDGHAVRVVDTVDALDAAIDGADALVVNAGGGDQPHPLDDRLADVVSGYTGAVLGIHVAATLLAGHDEWERTLGGRWVRGTSMHPERGPLTAKVVSRHPIVADWTTLSSVDEAYSWLRVAESSEVLLVHEHEGTEHAICWVATVDGRRIAYDALGHDVEAYESPAARELISRLCGWLTGNPFPTPLSLRGETLDSAL